MVQFVCSLFSHLFNRDELNLKKQLRAPRESLAATERQIARQLRAYFRQHRRGT